MKINKYVLNSLITALILSILLVIFFIIIKAPGSKKTVKEDSKIVEEITISFDADGATNPKDIKIKKGESLTLPTITKDGYEFEGWYLNDTKVSNKTEFIKDTKLVAKWSKKSSSKEEEKKDTFTITFNSMGGSKVADKIVNCGDTLTLPANPTKDGYEFVSWVDKNDKPILNGALLACEDTTLYADFKKIEEKKEEPKQMTVTFKVDGSIVSSSKINCGDALTLPTNPTKEGFEFEGWYLYNQKVINGATFTTCEDVVIEAKFNKIETPEEEPKQDETKDEEEENKD